MPRVRPRWRFTSGQYSMSRTSFSWSKLAERQQFDGSEGVEPPVRLREVSFPSRDVRTALYTRSRTSPKTERRSRSPKTCCWIVWLKILVLLTDVVILPPCHLMPNAPFVMRVGVGVARIRIRQHVAPERRSV